MGPSLSQDWEIKPSHENNNDDDDDDNNKETCNFLIIRCWPKNIEEET